MRPKAILRSEYLIDRHHVVFESGAGWLCVCAEFAMSHDCRHTRESQGRRAAQMLIANRMGSPMGIKGIDSSEQGAVASATPALLAL
jgi:hypothetical protein